MNSAIDIQNPHFDRAALRSAIQEKYSEVARTPECEFHFVTGRPLAERLSYSEDMLNAIPSGAIDSFAGVGNPFSIAPIPEGAVVLDIGSGAGMDSLIASRIVGPNGKVVGIDMTSAMVERARDNARQMDARNVRFEQGYAESLPFADESVDVVISNGVINLCPSKTEVYDEIYRVLKPGGRIQIADVLLTDPVPTASVDLIHLWTDCVAGGLLDEDYLRMLQDTGFVDFAIYSVYDVFSDARIARSAARYGARGVCIRGTKVGG